MQPRHFIGALKGRRNLDQQSTVQQFETTAVPAELIEPL